MQFFFDSNVFFEFLLRTVHLKPTSAKSLNLPSGPCWNFYSKIDWKNSLEPTVHTSEVTMYLLNRSARESTRQVIKINCIFIYLIQLW